jgi:hypothetical protein
MGISAIAFVTLAWTGAALAAATDQGSATVIRISGDARYSRGNNDWHTLKEGDIVQPGTVLQTASKSYIDLILYNEQVPLSQQVSLAPSLTYRPEGEAVANVVRMYENTVLSVDKLTSMQTGADKVTETQLDLRAGKIFGAVKRMGGASKYEVKYPTGIAGIRGTVYLLDSKGVISIYSGSAVEAFTKPDGTPGTQVVNQGYQFTPETGQLTPIPSGSPVIQDIVTAIKQLGVLPPGAPPSSFAPDVSNKWVSPTIGSGGH